MNSDQFQQFVVDKLLLIEQRISKIEAKSALIGTVGGTLAGAFITILTRHLFK